MAEAAERRDLAGGETAAGVAFPPLKRRIRPVEPDRAARLWLERFEALKRPPAGNGNSTGIGADAGTGAGAKTDSTGDPATAGETGAGPHADGFTIKRFTRTGRQSMNTKHMPGAQHRRRNARRRRKATGPADR